MIARASKRLLRQKAPTVRPSTPDTEQLSNGERCAIVFTLLGRSAAKNVANVVRGIDLEVDVSADREGVRIGERLLSLYESLSEAERNWADDCFNASFHDEQSRMG